MPQEEGKKENLENVTHIIKICPNRGHIFKNKLRNTWTAISSFTAVNLHAFFKLL